MKKGFCILLLLALGLTACGSEKETLNPKNPVTLSIWHVYGSQTESPLNDVIDTFNRTEGKEQGIIISIDSVTDSSAIDQELIAAAKEEPGAAELPDLFTAYPRAAQEIGYDRLLDWNDYFTEEELNAYVDDFLAEGYLEEKLLMLPIAKSTELLFLNQTLYDRFAAEAGLSLETLSDYTGIFDACEKYYDYSNGRNLFQINDFYHYFLCTIASMGEEFVKDGRLDCESGAFEKAFLPMAHAAIYGGLCVEEGYASDRWKTAEVLGNTGSTAGVLYLRDYVTYADNTTEDIKTLLTPYPTFENGKPFVVHRGSGLFAVKSEDQRKNEAAAIFAKWLAEKEQNLAFVTHAGYLPVTDEAFSTLFADLDMVENEKYQMQYEAVKTLYDRYTFVPQPLFANAGAVQTEFEKIMKTTLSNAHAEYWDRVNTGEAPEEAMTLLLTEALTDVKEQMQDEADIR